MVRLFKSKHGKLLSKAWCLYRTFIYICCFLTVIISGCIKETAPTRSNEQDELINAKASSSDLKSDIVVFIPSKKDTGIDINTNISVRCNNIQDATKISLLTFFVYNGSSRVDGKLIYSDTSVVFIPDVNLKYNTSYTVEINGTVSITLDRELKPSIKGIIRKWSFTTGSESLYLMQRQS